MQRKGATRTSKWGFWAGLGLFLFLFVMDVPDGLDPRGFRVLAVGVLMGVFWLTEALPIPVTALLPLALFPLLGVMPAKEVSHEYANDIIFLFFGGFFLALTLERWNLHRRMALKIISAFGTRPHLMILGVMVAVAALSMWISNTATVLCMLPIALAMIEELEEQGVGSADVKKFSLALLLGIAYAANVGGMGSPIGTPPNGVFADNVGPGRVPSFAEWLMFGAPLVVILIPIVWLFLTRVLFSFPAHVRFGDRDFLRSRLREMGPLSREEKTVLAVFGLTILLWVTRKDLVLGGVTLTGWASLLQDLGMEWIGEKDRPFLADSVVSVLAVLVLCSIRVRRGGPPLADWSLASRIPWGVLILLGGGFALASGFVVGDVDGGTQNLARWIGGGLVSFKDWPPLLLFVVVALCISFLTEIMSNTATTQVSLPIILTMGEGDLPFFLALAATLSASCAFMLPVATPPNAIVFGTGRIGIGSMVRAGVVLNVICAAVVACFVWFVARPMLGG